MSPRAEQSRMASVTIVTGLTVGWMARRSPSSPFRPKLLTPGESVPTNLNQTNIQPVYDIYASVQGRDLGIGLLFAAVLVYFLMVVNYQNFGDPLVVILALPATLCGILTMLFITGTTLSVPSVAAGQIPQLRKSECTYWVNAPSPMRALKGRASSPARPTIKPVVQPLAPGVATPCPPGP
jgi:hypothetical protein